MHPSGLAGDTGLSRQLKVSRDSVTKAGQGQETTWWVLSRPAGSMFTPGRSRKMGASGLVPQQPLRAPNRPGREKQGHMPLGKTPWSPPALFMKALKHLLKGLYD